MFEPVITQLLGLSLRITLLMVTAFLIVIVLRKASASLRYWVWVLTLLGVLGLPLLMIAGPVLSVPTQPAPDRGASLRPTAQANQRIPAAHLASIPIQQPDIHAEPAVPAAVPTATSDRLSTSGVSAAPLSEQGATPDEAGSILNLTVTLILLWLSGVAGVLLYGCAQFHRVRRLTRRGTRITHSQWNAQLAEATRQFRVRRPVQIVISHSTAVPMAWGVWHPTILFPSEAQSWSQDRRHVVLLHEVIHIARFDTLVNWLGLVVCALYWFNPLVWIMMKRLAVECEQSCDDTVLNGGTLGVDYATHLVALAHGSLTKQAAVPGVMAVIQRSTLSTRVHRILNTRLRRNPLSRLQRWMAALAAALLLFPLGGLKLVPMLAQNNETVLTLAIPDYFPFEIETVLEGWYAQHPDIKIVVRPPETNGNYFGDPLTEPDQYYEKLNAYATLADVLLVDSYSLSGEATWTGAFLDLKPLIEADASLSPGDFYPAAWKLFQWEGGFWALPASVYPTLIIYDPAAFDEAGLAYPNETWTLGDFTRAIPLLTRYDADQAVRVPGFEGEALPILASTTTALTDTGLWQDPTFIAQLEEWGAVYQQLHANPSPEYDVAQIPLIIAAPGQRLRGIPYGPPSDEPLPEYVATLLPGQTAIVGGSGFAVSAGTAAPEAAYELAKYLSGNPVLSQSLSADRPARPALYANPIYSPEVEALIDQGLQNGLTPADMPYEKYLRSAISTGSGQALLDLSARLAAATQKIDELRRRSEVEYGSVVSVPTPVPTPILQPGEISLRFLYQTGSVIWPGHQQWNALIQEFVQRDPEVGQIQFDTNYDGEQSIWNSYDCAYIGDAFPPFGAIHAFGMGLYRPEEELLPLDPLFNADASFDSQDFVPGTLEQMQINGQTYGYPLTVLPSVIWYDPAALEATGVPLPEQGWTVSQFIEALFALRQNPEVPVAGGGDLIDLLISALGGRPIDKRSGTWVPNFTDPATVDAIQQTLDLVRDGFLYYVGVGELGFIRNDELPLVMGSFYRDETSFYQNYRATTLPTGADSVPITYQMGGAYISRYSPAPEACYRFIRFLSQHPEVLGAMPARRSQFGNPAFDKTTSQIYPLIVQQFEAAEQLDLLNSYDMEDWMVTLWLDQVYHNYIRIGGDLNAMLAEAQAKTEEYLACAAGIEPPNDSPPFSYDVSVAYSRRFQACAVSVDPEIEETFPYWND